MPVALSMPHGITPLLFRWHLVAMCFQLVESLHPTTSSSILPFSTVVLFSKALHPKALMSG